MAEQNIDDFENGNVYYVNNQFVNNADDFDADDYGDSDYDDDVPKANVEKDMDDDRLKFISRIPDEVTSILGKLEYTSDADVIEDLMSDLEGVDFDGKSALESRAVARKLWSIQHELIRFVDEDVLNDEKFILGEIARKDENGNYQNNAELINFAGKELTRSNEFFKRAYERNPGVLDYINPDVFGHKKVMLDLIEINRAAFLRAAYNLQSDMDFMVQSLVRNPNAFETVRDWVENAATTVVEGTPFKTRAELLKQVTLEAVSLNSDVYEKLPSDWRDNTVFKPYKEDISALPLESKIGDTNIRNWFNLVVGNPVVHVPRIEDQLKQEQNELTVEQQRCILKTMVQIPTVYDLMNETNKKDKEIIAVAIKSHPSNIAAVPEKTLREVVLGFKTQNISEYNDYYDTIALGSKPKQTEIELTQMFKDAIREHYSIVGYLDYSYRNFRAFMIECVKIDGRCLRWAGDNVRDQIDICKLAMANRLTAAQWVRMSEDNMNAKRNLRKKEHISPHKYGLKSNEHPSTPKLDKTNEGKDRKEYKQDVIDMWLETYNAFIGTKVIDIDLFTDQVAGDVKEKVLNLYANDAEAVFKNLWKLTDPVVKQLPNFLVKLFELLGADVNSRWSKSRRIREVIWRTLDYEWLEQHGKVAAKLSYYDDSFIKKMRLTWLQTRQFRIFMNTIRSEPELAIRFVETFWSLRKNNATKKNAKLLSHNPEIARTINEVVLLKYANCVDDIDDPNDPNDPYGPFA